MPSSRLTISVSRPHRPSRLVFQLRSEALRHELQLGPGSFTLVRLGPSSCSHDPARTGWYGAACWGSNRGRGPQSRRGLRPAGSPMISGQPQRSIVADRGLGAAIPRLLLHLEVPLCPEGDKGIIVIGGLTGRDADLGGLGASTGNEVSGPAQGLDGLVQGCRGAHNGYFGICRLALLDRDLRAVQPRWDKPGPRVPENRNVVSQGEQQRTPARRKLG